MNITILHLIEGARQANGLTVIIDVFRAFSLACYMIDQGAESIIPVADIELAYSLKKKNPGYILVGERNNKKLPGFDFGNSPFEISNVNFSGKTVIHTTSAGTHGITNASNAIEIITGSFVNATAIVNYINKKMPDQVSLVCMGYNGKNKIEEDTFCAEYIRNCLTHRPNDFNQMVKIISKTSGKRFFVKETQTDCPSEDFYLCLDLNKFNFILKAEKHNNLISLKKINI